MKLRDVLFLSHAKPRDEAQAELWKRLVEGELATPDTWEVALSAWRQQARGVGASAPASASSARLAVLRNLRNMKEAGVDEKLVIARLRIMKTDRVLPFRFIAAARYAPQWEAELERQCSGAVEADCESWRARPSCSSTSPARWWRRSPRVRRCCVPTLLTVWRSCCARSPRSVSVYTFSDRCVRVPARRGFALRDAMDASQPHGATYLGPRARGDPRAVRPLDRHHRRAGRTTSVPRPRTRAT